MRRYRTPFNRLKWLILVAALGIIISFQLTTTQAQEAETFEITLETLGYTTQTLNGPGSRYNYFFSLPADWDMRDGSYVNLNLDYFARENPDTSELSSANFDIAFNGEPLTQLQFGAEISRSVRVDLPTELFRPAEDENINQLTVDFQVNFDDCADDEAAELTIFDTSLLHFAYQQRPATIDLRLYPKPLYYSRAFETNPARFVLPDTPNNAELQATAMMAANLGYLTRYNLPLEVTHGPANLPETATEQHLLVIGTPDRMPLLPQLELPIPLQPRQLDLSSQMPTSITSRDPFTYTITIRNTSSTTRTLSLEDQLPPLVEVLACDFCQQPSPQLLRWTVGTLAPNESVTTAVVMQADESVPIGHLIERTSSLMDITAGGEVINVDTMTTSVRIFADTTPRSPTPKGPFFFAFNNRGVPENDGVVQAVLTPWSDSHGIFVVTGLTNPAIELAAQALAATTEFPGMRGNFALVQQTLPLTTPQPTLSQTISFERLGYNDAVLEGRDDNTEVRFFVPRGAAFLEDPHIALHMRYGQALTQISTTLEINLNGRPLHSIPLDREISELEWHRIPVPARALQAENNRLSFTILGDGWPECMDDETASRFWVTIYADSFMYLPFFRQLDLAAFNLQDYPSFLASPNLQDLAVLLPAEVDQETSQQMAQILALIGDSINVSNFFAPKVALTRFPTPAQWADYNTLLIGRPTENPYIALVNDSLPQPFVPDTDTIEQQVDNIIYRLPPNYDLGHIQLLASPWNSDYAMLAVTGTTDTGVGWALNALTDKYGLSRDIAGNLAVLVDDMTLRSTDTREVPDFGTEASEAPVVQPAFPASSTTIQGTVTPTPPQLTPTIDAAAPSPTPDLLTLIAEESGGIEADEERQLSLSRLIILAGSIVVVLLGLVLTLWQRRW